jgi:hypothetical protein
VQVAFTAGHYGRFFAGGKARSGILPPLVQVKQPFAGKAAALI